MGTPRVYQCEHCKEIFPYERESSIGKRFCPECAKIRRRENSRNWWRNNRDKQKAYKEAATEKVKQSKPSAAVSTRKKTNKPLSELARINAEARERGLTYGKYVPIMNAEKEEKNAGSN